MHDFLIVGGGIAGVATAARLSELGQVLVLEAEDGLGYHASGRSAAMFEENYGPPSVVALTKESRSFLEETDVLRTRGFLMVALPEEHGAFETSAADLAMEQIAVSEARTLLPVLSARVSQAAYHSDAWDIDTDLLLQRYAKMARRAGAEIILSARVVAIERDASGWRVSTAGGAHTARLLVNAAGAWADHVAEMAGVAPIGVIPKRRSMARVPAPGGRDVSRWPMLFGPGETWYAKPDAGKLLISPADETPVEPHDAWPEDLTLAEGIDRYEQHVSEPVTRVEHSWAGLRTFTPDGTMAIGFDPGDPSFIWCAGQGGYGIQSSAGYSALVADLVAGRAPALDRDTVAALSPGRFMPA